MRANQVVGAAIVVGVAMAMGVTPNAPAAGDGHGGHDMVSAMARGPAAPAGGVAALGAPQTPARGSNRPVLVVIVVDQLAAWIADERWPALPADGGFNRLRREGLYVRELHYSHAATDTAPGHAALFTGAPPHDSGIVANETLAPDTGAPISFLTDPTARELVPGPAAGGEAKVGSSLRALRVETLADVFGEARPGAQIVSLSLKDRSALFGGGRRPSAALWLDPDLGAFVTSTAVASSFPSWAAGPASAAAVRDAMTAPWELGDPAWVAAHATGPDNAPGEGDYLGLGKKFPHTATSARALRATPAGDTLLLALAEAAAVRLAASDRPALLAVSLSSHDYVAHVFGPHSWEAWDELAKLDRGIARFLGRLDQLFGVDGYAVMLTGDHGSNALPEASRRSPGPWCPSGAVTPGHADHWQRSCGPRRRLLQAEVVAALETHLGGALGAGRGPFVKGISEPLLYLTDRARALPPADRKRLVEATALFLRKRFNVAQVVDLRTTPANCPPPSDESWQALVCRSSRADSPGDLYLMLSAGTFFDPRLAVGAGTSHGSPNLYDRAVPLLVRAPGRVHAGATRTDPVSFTAFARTAAALLGIRAPATAAIGEDLTAR